MTELRDLDKDLMNDAQKDLCPEWNGEMDMPEPEQDEEEED